MTYYYGSKEKLFVEVACAAVLRAGKRAEVDAADATRSAITPRSWSDPSWARALPVSNCSWKR